MNPSTRLALVAAATVGLGLAGYHLLTLGDHTAVAPVQPIPLRTGLGPISLLAEPNGAPYELLMDQAVANSPSADEAGRRELLARLRELRTSWNTAPRLAAVPATTAPDGPGQL